MKEKMENQKNAVIFVLGVCLAITIIFHIYTSYELINTSNQRDNLVEMLLLDSELTQAAEIALEAENYYSLASESYDYSYFVDVINYCEQSRDKSAKYVQEIRNIKAGINDEVELLDSYSEILTEHINIYNNLYEACEYFESAARCYSNADYDCGGNNIDGHNEKIKAHDEAVNRNNEALAEFNKILKDIQAGDYDDIRG